MPLISKLSQTNLLPTVRVIWFLAFVLFWLPVVGSFVAGFAGSRKANNHQTAFTASIISMVTLGIAIFFLSTSMTALPVLGAIARKGSLYLSLSFMIPLVLGGLVGIAYGK